MKNLNLTLISLFLRSFFFSNETLAQNVPKDLFTLLSEVQKEFGPLSALNKTQGMSEALVERATVWPNPELVVSREDVAASQLPNFKKGNVVLELQMPVELPGKRAAKRELALEEAALSQLEVQKQRKDILLEVALAFLDLKEKEALNRVMAQRFQLISQTAQIAIQKFKSGKLSGLEQSRALSLADLAKMELEEKEQNEKIASRRAAAYLRVSQFNASQFLFSLETIKEIKVTGIELGQPLAEKIAQVKVKKNLAELQLAQKGVFSDINLTAGTVLSYKNDPLFSMGFSFPLPLFDRNQGERRLVQMQMEMEQLSSSHISGETQRNATDLRNTLEFSMRKANHLKGNILPKLRESTFLLTEAFDKGRVSYLEMVEAQETLFSVEEKYLEALVLFHRSQIQILFSGDAEMGLSQIKSLYSTEAKIGILK
jgi:cobalt-zinc-cadmium efflux system outer membrane protein